MKQVTKTGLYSTPINLDSGYIDLVPDVTGPNNIPYDFNVSSTHLETEEYVRRAHKAYMRDGLVKRAVDTYDEVFKDIKLIGNPEIIKYLEKRLDLMSLVSGESWKTTIFRSVHEVWKTGNAMLVKMRGNSNDAFRAVYEDAPYALKAFQLVSIEELEPRQLTTGHIVWRKSVDSALTKIVDQNPEVLEDTLINSLPDSDIQEKDILPGRDCLHLAYKKGAGQRYGWGLTLSALDSVLAHKHLERGTWVMLSKYQSPLTHVTVAPSPHLGTSTPLPALYNQLKNTLTSRGPDGFIITPDSVKINAIGSESRAIRTSEYLDYGLKKNSSALGASPSILGLENATASAAEAADKMLMRKARHMMNQIAWAIESQLFWEIIYESGKYDPYTNPDHRVTVGFVESDEELLRKTENHNADLYTKNVIDLDEARKRSDILGKPNVNRLHHKLTEKDSSTQVPKPSITDSLSSEVYKVLKTVAIDYPYTEEKAALFCDVASTLLNIPLKQQDKLIELLQENEFTSEQQIAIAISLGDKT
jgi:hypothetical protein